MFIDIALFNEALQAGLDTLYDVNNDGEINSEDIELLNARVVPGITAAYGSEEAIKEWNLIEQAAQESGQYRGQSLAWGSKGYSELFRDRLLVQGYDFENADILARKDYVNRRYERLAKGLPV
jgi:hypothetical protein